MTASEIRTRNSDHARTRNQEKETPEPKSAQSSHIIFDSSDSDEPSSDEAHSSGPPSSQQEQPKDQLVALIEQFLRHTELKSRHDIVLIAPPQQVNQQVKGKIDGPTWSVGAELHHQNLCKPCAWFWRDKGCDAGGNCIFCHLCGQKEFKGRRKALKKRIYPQGDLKIRQEEQSVIDLKRAEAASTPFQPGATHLLAAGAMDKRGGLIGEKMIQRGGTWKDQQDRRRNATSRQDSFQGFLPTASGSQEQQPPWCRRNFEFQGFKASL